MHFWRPVQQKMYNSSVILTDQFDDMRSSRGMENLRFYVHGICRPCRFSAPDLGQTTPEVLS